ncbi:MAG: shikimate kinase [Ruminococcus sp.]
MNNIILCGFMGCGKTTVGKNLSTLANMKFVDMDKYIEKKADMTVSQIFEKFGEEGFRDMEHKACLELSESTDYVIASGGGTLVFDRNVEVLSKTGTIVLIDVSYETLCNRLKNDKKRPLLQCENRNEKIKELLNKRMPLYKKASAVTVNGDQAPKKVAQEIFSKVNSH